MSFPVLGDGAAVQAQVEEWVVTTTNGLVTKIERVDNATRTRKELTADEYAGLAASYYAIYYTGIRDYAQAVASGNRDLAQAYYQGMSDFFGVMGQT